MGIGLAPMSVCEIVRQSPTNMRLAMTCISNRTNMVMQCRTSSFGTRKSLGTTLLLVFGFQVLLSGMVDVASLNAAETVTASGSSPMKSHNGQGSRTEGFAAISGAEPILKSGKESGGSKIGNNPGD